MQNEEKKEFWAIVSLMGHTQLAGFLSEYTMGGCSFLKLTIPETSKQPEWTRLFKDNSVYSIDPVTEDIARYRAEGLNVSPLSIWEVNSIIAKQLVDNGAVIIKKSDLPEGFVIPSDQPKNNNALGPWSEDEDELDDDDERPF